MVVMNVKPEVAKGSRGREGGKRGVVGKKGGGRRWKGRTEEEWGGERERNIAETEKEKGKGGG